jgi:hypothetical protein
MLSSTQPSTKSTNPCDEFVAICKQYNFVGYSFERIAMKLENGEWKKEPIMQPNWKHIDRTNYERFIKPRLKAFAIITGNTDKYSGLTVIDCDTPEAYKMLIDDFPELSATLTAKTKKGMHIYCKFVEVAKNNTNSFQSYPNVDIRTKGGVIFAQPTVYDWVDEEVSYKFINLGADVIAMPQKLIEDLKDHSKIKPKVSRSASINPKISTKPHSNPHLQLHSNDYRFFLFKLFRIKELGRG